MINKRVENFLEHTNMNYMFCLLSNLEVLRLNSLPPYVKQKFDTKITELSMDHIAQNDIPDYIMDIEEAKAEMERLGLTPEEFEAGGRRESFVDEEEFELEPVPEDFQDDSYRPAFPEENYKDDLDEEETADNDTDEE
jgi:hypothetical protein